MKLDRRNFLRGAALTSGATLLGPRVVPSQDAGLKAGFTGTALLDSSMISAGLPAETEEAVSALLPAPEDSGIEHLVVVMTENRSFDRFLGWLPDADGKQARLHYADSSGASHPTYPLAPNYTGCPSPGH
jgi:phospholipase C